MALIESKMSCSSSHICGVLLSLKLSSIFFEKHTFVCSKSCISGITGIPLITCEDPTGVASGMSPFKNVVTFSDESLIRNIASVLDSFQKKENVIIVCANKSAFSIGKMLIPLCSYTATASISHPADFMNKVKKSQQLKGIRFIEILSPCNESWGFNQSDTVEAARSTVESSVWPLYEIENGKLAITHIPTHIEPVSVYLEFRKKISADEKFQDIVSRNWKSLSEGVII